MTQGRCPDDEGSGVDPPILIVGCDSILIGVSFHLVRDTSAGLSRALSVVPAGIPVIICTGLSSTVILYMKCAPPKENVGLYKFISASSKKNMHASFYFGCVICCVASFLPSALLSSEQFGASLSHNEEQKRTDVTRPFQRPTFGQARGVLCGRDHRATGRNVIAKSAVDG